MVAQGGVRCNFAAKKFIDMETTKRSFTLSESIIRAVNCLSNPIRNRLIQAAVNYALYGDEPEFTTATENALWIVIAELIEVKGYERPYAELFQEVQEAEQNDTPAEEPSNSTLEERKKKLQAFLNERDFFDKIRETFNVAPSRLRRLCNAIMHRWTDSAETDWSVEHLFKEIQLRLK